MDFITSFPKVFGKDYIFLVVDRINKFTHLFSINTNFTTTQVIELFFKQVFIFHGIPKNILSDKDNIFFSAFWKELFKMVGKYLTPNTRYNPQNGGQKEMVNQQLEGYLINYGSGKKKAWIKQLHLGEFSYNTTFQMFIGMSPLK